MTIETLLDILNDARVNITGYVNDTVYITKPDPDSDWYQPNTWDEVYNALEENGVDFSTNVCNHEEIFQTANLYIVIYTEE